MQFGFFQIVHALLARLISENWLCFYNRQLEDQLVANSLVYVALIFVRTLHRLIAIQKPLC